ncbi:MAG: CBS domain-containing protein [Proteobacteria bacterium]|nr:CBS domain-containing protein [Pseudomonadota bacterium]
MMASPVHTLPQSSCMDEVIQIMNDRGFRRVPIVDDKNQLVGIVNLTELQTAINGALERRGRDLEITVMARTSELQAANAKLERLSLRRLDRGAQSARHRRQAQRTPLALSAIRKLVFGYSARHRSLQIAP